MKIKIIFSISVMFLSLATYSCSDEKTKICQKTYKKVAKCLPKLASNKELQVKLCRKTFKKSNTQGTIQCAQKYSNCQKFKQCLSFGAMCQSFSGKEFDNCLINAPKCSKIPKNKMSKCLKCISEGKTNVEECMSENEDNENKVPVNKSTKKTTLKKDATPTTATPKKTPTTTTPKTMSK